MKPRLSQRPDRLTPVLQQKKDDERAQPDQCAKPTAWSVTGGPILDGTAEIRTFDECDAWRDDVPLQ